MDRPNQPSESPLKLVVTLLTLLVLFVGVLNVLGYAFAFSRVDPYIDSQYPQPSDRAPAAESTPTNLQSI